MLQELENVIRIVGSLSAVARGLNVNRQVLYHWTKIPKGRVIALEKLQKSALAKKERALGDLSALYMDRTKLRPDLYPKAKKGD